MGQSSGTETVTQNSEPWSQAQPYLQDIFRNSQSLYRQGAEYFPGSTVVPFSPLTERGMTGLEHQYSQRNPVGYQTASNTLHNVAQSGGNNPFIQGVQQAGQASNPYTSQIAAAGGQANPFINDVRAASQVQNDAGANVLNDFANNGQQNPYLDQMFDRAAGRVRDNTAAMFSKAGRYGSVAHQDQLSDSLGDMANNFYGQAYETDANRRFGAAQALGQRQAGDISRGMQGAQTLASLGEAQAGRGIGALSTAAGFAGQDASRNLGAQQAAAGLNQGANAQAMQAAGMMPMLHDYAGANNRGLMELGGMREAKAGQQLGDAMNRWNFGQNAGWDLLNRYNATIQPIAGLGGSSTGTQPSQGPSTLQTLGGLGMMGLGLFSDERLKEDIEPLGERGGHKWYSYRYIWDEPGTRHEGVMAHEVEQTRPDAVAVHENGFKVVNYGALGLTPRQFIERGTR